MWTEEQKAQYWRAAVVRQKKTTQRGMVCICIKYDIILRK